ncbi:MAG: hypothetical protein ACFFD4_23890, partial [Candidatus Odinarchaeota archaeon]
MVRLKLSKKRQKNDIKDKTPANDIKDKIPIESIEYVGKDDIFDDETPEDSRNSVVIPPPRRRKTSPVEKSTTRVPSNSGIRDASKSKQTNVNPPVSHQRDHSISVEKKPVLSPLKDSKDRINRALQKTQDKNLSKLRLTPSSGGAKNDKKKERPDNQVLPDEVRTKKPVKEKIPVAEGLSKDRKKVSKRLPGEIRTKKPVKEKIPVAEGLSKDRKKVSK